MLVYVNNIGRQTDRQTDRQKYQNYSSEPHNIRSIFEGVKHFLKKIKILLE
jgi:hypothetical protein